MKIRIARDDEAELSISALIDMVFLLLVFFLVTSSLVKSEGDLGIKLPGVVQQSQQVEMLDEQILEVRETGRVFLNGQEFGRHASQQLPDLEVKLVRYRLASEAARNEPMITIWAEDKTRHQRVIDVMNACAAAGIKNLTFTAAAE